MLRIQRAVEEEKRNRGLRSDQNLSWRKILDIADECFPTLWREIDLIRRSY